MVLAAVFRYLCARFYDPTNGRFNRLDPWVGDINNPLSLHKYLYVLAYPIQGTDPSGLVTLSSTIHVGGISGNLRAQNQSGQSAAGANVGRQIASSAQQQLDRAINALRQSPNLRKQWLRRMTDHIIGPHTPPASVASAGKSLFRTANPRLVLQLIDKTMKTGQVAGNTAGRAGFIFTRTFGSPVGTNASGQLVYTVKVVVSEAGCE